MGAARAAAAPPSKDGRRPKHRRRDLVDAICYVDRTGFAWRALPVDFPSGQTVYGFFAGGQATGVTKGLPDGLHAAKGRHTDPTARVIDS